MVKRIVFKGFVFACAFAFLAVLFFAGFANAGISSSAAQEKAGEILGSDAGDANSLSQPFEVGSDSYWVFFFSIYSPKRMLVVISDSKPEQGVLTDRDRLYRVGSAVYSYAVIEEFLKQRGWGFSEIEPVLDSARGVISEDEQRLAAFSSQTQSLYPALSSSFNRLDGALNKLSDQVSLAQTNAADGSAVETTFASDYSSATLASEFRQYNASLRSLESTFAAYDVYQKEITDFGLTLYKANVTSTDAKDINDNLKVLRDVGLADLRNKFVSQQPQLEFARLVSANDKWVNDSIESTLYRKNRREALDLVASLESPVESLFNNEASIEACGVSQDSFAQVRKDWNDARYFLSKDSPSGYEKALEKANAVSTQLTQIQKVFTDCNAAPTSSASSNKNQSVDYSPYVALLLIILLGIVAYSVYRKKQEELEQFGGQQ